MESQELISVNEWVALGMKPNVSAHYVYIAYVRAVSEHGLRIEDADDGELNGTIYFIAWDSIASALVKPVDHELAAWLKKAEDFRYRFLNDGQPYQPPKFWGQ